MRQSNSTDIFTNKNTLKMIRDEASGMKVGNVDWRIFRKYEMGNKEVIILIP